MWISRPSGDVRHRHGAEGRERAATLYRDLVAAPEVVVKPAAPASAGLDQRAGQSRKTWARIAWQDVCAADAAATVAAATGIKSSAQRPGRLGRFSQRPPSLRTGAGGIDLGCDMAQRYSDAGARRGNLPLLARPCPLFPEPQPAGTILVHALALCHAWRASRSPRPSASGRSARLLCVRGQRRHRDPVAAAEAPRLDGQTRDMPQIRRSR